MRSMAYRRGLSWSGLDRTCMRRLRSRIRGRDEESMDGVKPSLDSVFDNVVKVFSTRSPPHYSMPWQNRPQEQITGSGFVADTVLGPRVLTNAHVIANNTYVEVRKNGLPTRFEARVEFVAHECDVAALTILDRSFWKRIKPLQLEDELPQLQNAITVVGYPTGGDNLSITSGVVSRIEMQNYSHTSTQLLALQIDAAINSGNSGGPALLGNKVVGIAFQNLVGADGIGFVIPTCVIRHFLNCAASSKGYRGFCALEVKCQELDNPQLRQLCGLSKGDSGVRINSIAPLSHAAEVLKPGDVLTSFAGQSIANDGTVSFLKTGRISFQHLASLRNVGDRVPLGIFRGERRLDVEVEMEIPNSLVPTHHFDNLPPYYVIGGLVFTRLTQPLLHEYGEYWTVSAPRRLVHAALYELPKYKDQEIVVLCDVLPDRLNVGYQKMVDLRLLKFNDVEVRNLEHLKELVAKNKEQFWRFQLDDDWLIAMDPKLASRASKSILRRYRVPTSEG